MFRALLRASGEENPADLSDLCMADPETGVRTALMLFMLFPRLMSDMVLNILPLPAWSAVIGRMVPPLVRTTGETTAVAPVALSMTTLLTRALLFTNAGPVTKGVLTTATVVK